MEMRAPSRFATTSRGNCAPSSACEPAPACPACGGLRCLCRPRFFAGQLLTEDDLNRLDGYIVAKNQLHNRYLVGWGVACGLEVVCATCEDKSSVLVRPGYALSPCGNDIVVCGEQIVDVCALINDCAPKDDLCLSAEMDANDCRTGNETWILGICYAERSARGVTPLLNASDASGGCACGASPAAGGCSCGRANKTGKKSGCGCGTGKAGKCSCGATSSSTRAPKMTPSCEPTLVCEGYSFKVWKAPKPEKNTQRAWGEAARRFVCCIEPLLLALGQLPTNDDTQSLSALEAWYFDLRDTVREFVVAEGLYDCTIAAQFSSLGLTEGAQAADIRRAAVDVILVAAALVQKCLCAALLPPCPTDAPADCVPIATLTVKRRPCQVLKICNVSARKFLVTIPNLQYWLSFLTVLPAGGPLARFRTLLERLCCTTLSRERAVPGDVWMGREAAPPAPAAPAANIAADVVAPPAVDPPVDSSGAAHGAFGQLLLEALAVPEREVNAATLLLGAMGGNQADGTPLVSDLELQNPADFLLAQQLAAPALRAAVPFDLSAIARLLGRGDGRIQALSSQVAELRRSIEELRQR